MIGIRMFLYKRIHTDTWSCIHSQLIMQELQSPRQPPMSGEGRADPNQPPRLLSHDGQSGLVIHLGMRTLAVIDNQGKARPARLIWILQERL